MASPVSLLSSFNTSDWTVAGAASISSGTLTQPISNNSYNAGAQTNVQWAIENSSLTWRFNGLMTSTDESCEVYFGMTDSSAAGSNYALGYNNVLGWYIDGDNSTENGFTPFYIVGGTAHDLTYHQIVPPIYLRIRETGGTVYWDYSTDGVSWTNSDSLADPFSSTLMNAMYVGANGGFDTAGDTGVTVTFDYLNPNTTPTNLFFF